MGLLDVLFGKTSNMENVSALIENGAVIIDVRTPAEFQGGHVVGSVNIPLQEIQGRLSEVKKYHKPVVLCCASGGRSGQATAFLKSQGVECENGGSWTQVNNLI